VCLHKPVPTCAYVDVYIYTYSSKYIYRYTYIHAYIYIHTYVHTHTHIHIYKHTCKTHIYIYIAENGGAPGWGRCPGNWIRALNRPFGMPLLSNHVSPISTVQSLGPFSTVGEGCISLVAEVEPRSLHPTEATALVRPLRRE